MIDVVRPVKSIVNISKYYIRKRGELRKKIKPKTEKKKPEQKRDGGGGTYA
tara:strand:+ start:448 stop:600 length:153 start_codon:yes stop_codon:yes gene_type:complete